jgi:hypothetical protein
MVGAGGGADDGVGVGLVVWESRMAAVGDVDQVADGVVADRRLRVISSQAQSWTL